MQKRTWLLILCLMMTYRQNLCFFLIEDFCTDTSSSNIVYEINKISRWTPKRYQQWTTFASESHIINVFFKIVIIHHCSYSSVKDKGVVHLYINKWIEVTFCLPHKVHSKSSAALSVKVNVSVYTTYGMCICHNDWHWWKAF